MDAKLSVLIGSEAAAPYRCSGSSGENSPMINTREPIKNQTLAASCDTGNTSEAVERASDFIYLFIFLLRKTYQAFSVSAPQAGIDLWSPVKSLSLHFNYF